MVFDVEASALEDDSYPIEIGWCFGDLVSDSFLIRPTEDWEQHGVWSWQSEEIHGIPQRDLLRYGIEVDEAARRLNATFHGYTVVCNAPYHDDCY